MLDGRWRGRVERGLEPVGKGLHRARVHPDALTILGLAFSFVTAFLIANGRLGLAVGGVVLTGVPDILDGTVARQSGKASPRGAFFDSVCDRVSDAVLLGGVAWFLAGDGAYLPILAFAAMSLSMLISYERAKAEGLGFHAKGGLMERAERLVLLAVGLAFDALVPVLWIMVVLSAITAIHRFAKVWLQATEPTEPRDSEPRLPARLRRFRHPRRPGRHDAATSEELELAGARTPRRIADWWASRQPRTRSRPRRRTRP